MYWRAMMRFTTHQPRPAPTSTEATTAPIHPISGMFLILPDESVRIARTLIFERVRTCNALVDASPERACDGMNTHPRCMAAEGAGGSAGTVAGEQARFIIRA